MSWDMFIVRMLFSMLLGFFIGLERQITGHPAGIRINVLICMGSSLFTLFPMIYGSKEIFRVASSIISGVGFLCSGVIFKDSGSVRGMNTAATLWCTAAIGVMASTGMYLISGIAAAVLILSNLVLRPLALKIGPLFSRDEGETQYRISVLCAERAEPEIRHMLVSANTPRTMFLNNLESGDVVGDQVEVVAEFLSMGKPKHHFLEEMVSKLLLDSSVIRAGWEIL